MYDNSIKVPLIVRWPEVVEANTINPSTMSNLDWFPTLVDIAQGQPSADNIIRGQSFLPAFLNPTTILSTDYYGAYSTLHQTVTHMRMYSNGQFKLIRDFHNHGRDEFYELTLDPEESNNLMSQPLNATNQVIVDKFDAKIRQVMMETNDPVYQRLNKNN